MQVYRYNLYRLFKIVPGSRPDAVSKATYLVGDEAMQNGATIRILIADDEQEARDAVRAQVEQIGHTVAAEAGDGAEAAELAALHKPDLALIDIRMPKQDGIEAARQIIEQTGCPVILLTGHTDEDLIREAADVGVYGYLTKPVRLADLQPIIEVSLARHRDLTVAKRRLEATKIIQRAKGILMDQYGLSEEEAHKKIHFAARSNNRQMQDVADEVIQTRKLP